MGEAGVVLPGQADAAAPPLDEGGGEPGDDAARRRGLAHAPGVVWGRRIRRAGIAGFVINAGGFGGVMAGGVHDYPYLPIALGCAFVSWVGRVMIVKTAQSVLGESDDPGEAGEPGA